MIGYEVEFHFVGGTSVGHYVENEKENAEKEISAYWLNEMAQTTYLRLADDLVICSNHVTHILVKRHEGVVSEG
jgi:hypothetical protein